MRCSVRTCEVRQVRDGRGVVRRPQSTRAPCSALGPREVVVRSAASIGVLAHGSWTTLDIRRDAAVDPIGAGDAFNAGYIAVRLRDGSIEEALRMRRALRCGGDDVAQ